MAKKPSDTLEALRDKLKKLKNKELRLEADLAIREHPEAELAITKVALALFEYDKANHALKAIEKPDEDTRNRLQVLSNQIRYHESKLETIKAVLHDTLSANGGVVSKYQKSFDKLTDCESKVAEASRAHEDDFFSSDIELAEIFSMANDVLKKFENVP